MTSPENKHEDRSAKVGRLGIRHLQVAVLCTATFICAVIHINLTVVIVSMTGHHNGVNTTDTVAPAFDWDEKIQGYVLSSFFWGSLLAQLPSGLLSEKFGGHRLLCGAILTTSLTSLLLPQCALVGGWKLVCFNRMLQGAGQGALFPCMFTLLGVWVPPAERSVMTSVSISALPLGIVVATPASAYIDMKYGWPYVFYVLGALGCVVAPIMFFLGADYPSKHRFITNAEKDYIHSSLGGAKAKMKCPWRQVLTTPSYLAAVMTLLIVAPVYIIILTEIPTFFGTVLNFDIFDNGLFSALPFLSAWLSSFVWSGMCNLIINRGWVRVTIARKLFNSIGFFGAALFMVLLSHSDNRTMSVVYLTTAQGFKTTIFVGVHSTFVDLAPNFSGAIFSVANLASDMVGLFGPIMVGYIVTEKGNAEQWRIVFYLCAALLILSNLVYVIWSTSETQWWNWPDKYKDKDEYRRQQQKGQTANEC